MILQLVKAPHSRLKKVCEKADPSLAHHRTLARRLVDTMKAYKAFGIAANQVFPGQLVRIIAVTTKEYRGAMLNPVILEQSGAILMMSEGCLSLKGDYKIPRMSRTKVSFQTIDGTDKTIEFNGIGSVVVQHEIDHLNGILASDYFDKIDEVS